MNISQPVPFQAVQLGQSVTLECYISGVSTIVWYKLTAAKGLQCVIGDFGGIYYSGNEGHVSIETDKVRSHIDIINIRPEDTGTYFCGVNLLDIGMEFGPGTFLMIQGISPPVLTFNTLLIAVI